MSLFSVSQIFAAEFDLSQAEKLWLESHPVIRLGVGTNYPPIQYVVEENGEWGFQGIASDYVEILRTLLGVELRIEWGITFSEAMDMGKNKEIDMFPSVAYTVKRSEFLNFTEGYLENPLVIFANEDAPFIGSIQDLSGLKVADVEALYIHDQLSLDVPGINFILASNAEECLENIAVGRADANVAGLISGSYLIRKNNWANIKVAAPTPYPNTIFRMAVRDDWPELVSILDKALKSIDSDSRNEINRKWIAVRYEYGINSFEVFLRFVIVIGISALIVFLALLWVRQLRREIRLRKGVENALTKREAELKEMVEDRELLIREVYHRVKNNLSLVASLVLLQASEFENKKDVKKMDMVVRRIQSIILLHEQLSISSDMKAIDVAKYFNDLVLGIRTTSRDSSPGIEIQHDIISKEFSSNIIIPLGLIVTELVTNALKYGFPDKNPGIIEIELAKTPEDRYLLRVRNDGEPFPEDVDLDHPRSLGLKLVQSLVLQLKGELELIRSPSPEFTITFS